MRLIDADAFNDWILSHFAEPQSTLILTLQGFIAEQPTAYDIDKVIEELNELDVKSITRYKNGNFGNFDGVEYYIKKRKAIEIVKQDFISDDVCEWKYNYSEYYFESSCDHIHIFMYDGPKENEYDFCPYCGKKIKVVE